MVSTEVLLDRFVYVEGSLFWRVTRAQNRAGALAGSIDSRGYWRLKVDNKQIFAHRAIWQMFRGEPPIGWIDHINGNPLDNRIENLRLANPRQNGANQHTVYSNSGFKGVTRVRRNGRFQVSIEGRYLSQHETAEAAARAYDVAAVRLFGEYARTNAQLGLLRSAS